MRSAFVLFRDEVAGVLTQQDDGSFTFRYREEWINRPDKPAISPTLPKSRRAFYAPFLFPFFFHLLPEGINRDAVCRLNRLDAEDDFGLLITAMRHDSVGSIRVLSADLQ